MQEFSLSCLDQYIIFYLFLSYCIAVFQLKLFEDEKCCWKGRGMICKNNQKLTF